ncbi:hypothetical protein K7X08_021263 [Anisodus acutangulus]|uniref:Uncharacterized protein n=1 Tax=Anisodus acutangulus TaxID=402998 RepID=A0A9Q1RAN0_9SOLA|nr:hypothetical protein K7X08_021263 [Anisodus acutangulus]
MKYKKKLSLRLIFLLKPFFRIQELNNERCCNSSCDQSAIADRVIFITSGHVDCCYMDLLELARREQEICIASQLFMLMDSIKSSRTSESHVVVVASTNRPDAIDPALRRDGRFDAEIEVTTPTEEERLHIVKVSCMRYVAASCNGYVGADLEALCHEAAMSAVRKCSDSNLEDDYYSINMEDWKHARSVVGPSITRGVTVEIPKVSWEDIGGLKDIKKRLQQAVEWPLKHSEAFERLGLSPSPLLRNTFRRARLAAPSIIFFDEADVVATKRGGSSSGSSIIGERLLSALLTEMDGLEQAKGILVLGATNRPHAIDAALMRPGRFDLVLYVSPPDLEARFEVLCVHTRDMKLSYDVNIRQIAEDTSLPELSWKGYAEKME